MNGDGRLSAEEFSIGLKSYGLKFTDGEVKDIMDSIDMNGNGFIDYTEFIAGCMKSKIYLKEDHLKMVFSKFDSVTISLLIIYRTTVELSQ